MYARCSIESNGAEYIAGVELRDDDNYVQFSRKLRGVMHSALYSESPVVHLSAAHAVEFALKSAFPERAYFIEVGNDDDWVQVYDPRGFVKERCECRCQTRSGS